MNIFHLDRDPVQSAQWMIDKHVVKMIVESAQLLSTAHRVLDGKEYYDKNKNGHKLKRWLHPTLEDKLYKASMVNHPSAIWCRESTANYQWLYTHFMELCKEYTYRYGKTHSTEKKLAKILKANPKNCTKTGLTEFNQAMPDYCKRRDPVDAYRIYYINEKRGFANWTNRVMPWWFQQGVGGA